MLAYQLLRPLAYLQIRDGQKWKIDIALPAILSSLTVAPLAYLGPGAEVFGSGGMVDRILDLLAILPGFYITALAAVATFNRPELDHTLPDPAPSLLVRRKDSRVSEDLTRRRLLTLIFGYLSFASLILFIFLVIISYSQARTDWSEFYMKYAGITIMFLYVMMFWNMVTVTLFGLYQLCDRIHHGT